MTQNIKPIRPVLRWFGGKWLLAPWILQHFPAHRVYVEPFGGAASVLLRKERSTAEVYNDLDMEVVNLFRVLRERGVELEQVLRLTPYAREEFAQSKEPSLDPLEQARRTVVRSCMGFGSNAHNKVTGFRRFSKGERAIPSQDWRNYPEALAGLVERLRGVVIENRDALAVIEAHDSPETLHYIDPPYVTSTRGRGNDYRHELTDTDHKALAELLHTVEGMVVLSGYRSPLYEQLFADWYKVERAALADGARERAETLWLNPACEAGQKQQGLDLVGGGA
ncbi:DNA adenine methylase [uncultured Microbulbifer sp.]|uniref:DNA adenine methylase n=1 Tax=uncultured Microbulbifer sp. TaxID=348147 RepID=UPI002632A1C1|nr:DNA adenine methylase [uncultured Microbulbifer sp.]